MCVCVCFYTFVCVSVHLCVCVCFYECACDRFVKRKEPKVTDKDNLRDRQIRVVEKIDSQCNDRPCEGSTDQA